MPSVVCFGEVLWDVLPGGTFLGGAPLNVAAHLAKLGCHSHLVSRVGNDARGHSACGEILQAGVGAAALQQDATLPTGEARALLDASGSASYVFETPAAFDTIAPDAGALALVQTADALVYGTLAQRDARSRSTLQQLIAAARFRVFDVNLRVPHHDAEVTRAGLREADLVKLNEEECGIVGTWLGIRGEPDALLHGIAALRAPARGAVALQLCITRGAQGAVLWSQGAWHAQAALPVKVMDTVGAGDAFLAMLLAQRLRGISPAVSMADAAALAAFVASQPGAVPHYDPRQVVSGYA